MWYYLHILIYHMNTTMTVQWLATTTHVTRISSCAYLIPVLIRKYFVSIYFFILSNTFFSSSPVIRTLFFAKRYQMIFWITYFNLRQSVSLLPSLFFNCIHLIQNLFKIFVQQFYQRSVFLYSMLTLSNYQ